MREVQEEQRMLLDTISGLQLQLSEVKQHLEHLEIWDTHLVLPGKHMELG